MFKRLATEDPAPSPAMPPVAVDPTAAPAPVPALPTDTPPATQTAAPASVFSYTNPVVRLLDAREFTRVIDRMEQDAFAARIINPEFNHLTLTWAGAGPDTFNIALEQDGGQPPQELLEPVTAFVTDWISTHCGLGK